ncbi:MAG: hypothetical protein DDT36_00494 [Firmicutes bacterium]|nr:hypothetical protein [Bacillota bacterium]
MRVRDPIHGDIVIDQVAKELLDTQALQRLRGVKQLGLTHYVYPGCVHTRFDHSLGTYHMARRLYQGAVGNPCPTELLAVGCAALLHDVGHMPFGHTLEEEFSLFAKHDSKERLARVLSDTEVGVILSRAGLYGQVADILLETLPRAESYLSEIIKGTIDADVLDYLRRDAYFAGLVHDYDDRVLDNFSVRDGRLVYRLVHKGLDRPDARSELVHLLRLRYYLTERLYYHHAKLAAGTMLAKMVERAGFTEGELLALTDEGLLAQCLSRATERHDTALWALADNLRWRRLYKRAFVQVADDALALLWQQRFYYEGVIAEAVGLDPTEVGIYLGPRGVLKEAEVTVLTKRGSEPLSLEESGDIAALARQYAALARFYVFAPPDKTQQVRRVVEDMLGRPSEYRKDLMSL